MKHIVTSLFERIIRRRRHKMGHLFARVVQAGAQPAPSGDGIPGRR